MMLTRASRGLSLRHSESGRPGVPKVIRIRPRCPLPAAAWSAEDTPLLPTGCLAVGTGMLRFHEMELDVESAKKAADQGRGDPGKIMVMAQGATPADNHLVAAHQSLLARQ